MDYTFESHRQEYERMYRDAQWLCGDTQDAIAPALQQLYDQGEASGTPYILTKARMLSYALNHVRLAICPVDAFAVICERNPFLTNISWQRNGKYCAEAIGEEAAALRQTYLSEAYFEALVDMSHTSPDWDALLTLGAPGLLHRAQAAYTASPNDFYQAVVITYTGFRDFILRFSSASRLAGREDLACMTDFLADNPPETLQQALELGWLYREMQEMEGELVRSMGIFDRQYLPFYQHDLAQGLLTPESAEELLLVYFAHCHAQASLGANVHYCFGGLLEDGIHDGCNALTRLAYSAYRRLHWVDPKMSLRMNGNTPEDVLHFAVECLKDGSNAILFANEMPVRKAFVRNGKDSQDLQNFIPIGCYEPAIMGKELCCSMTGRFNMAKIIEKLMADCSFEPETFDDVLNRYLQMLKEGLDTMMDWLNLMEPLWSVINPTTAISGTMQECMERGRDATDGGTKYSPSGIMCAGIGTVADSLAAIEKMVFIDKAISFAQLRQVLASDWEGQERLRLTACHRTPKWGNSDARADELGVLVAHSAADIIEKRPNSKGGHFQMGLWSIDFSLSYGKKMGATPDGRHKGEAISKNTGSSIGCDKEGVAGLVESVTKLDYSRFADGSVLDVMLPSKTVAGETGTQFIMNLLRTFQAKGGAFMHINIVSAEELKAAQREPEKYQNLQIRLCGWNVRFIDLKKDMQDCLIREAESKDA